MMLSQATGEDRLANKAFILNLIESKALRTALARIPDYLWQIPYKDLDLLIRPTLLHEELRYRFWKQANEALQKSSRIKSKVLYEGACTYTNLYTRVLTNHRLTAWIVRPDSDQEARLSFLREQALDHMMKILELPILRVDGTMNTPVIRALLGLIKTIQN